MEAFELREARRQLPRAAPPFHVWRNKAGQAFLEFHRDAGATLLRFVGLADFHIHGIACTATPAPGIAVETVERLYLQQVAALIVAGQGRLVLHGGANLIAGGAILFLGPGGAGKSTLSTYMALSGYALLSDDSVFLSDNWVEPSAAPVGLWSDSFEALVRNNALRREQAVYSDKIRLADHAVPKAVNGARLTAIYLLAEASTISVKPVGQSEALTSLLAQMFMLDVEDRVMMAASFESIGRIVAETPVRRLGFPRRYDALPEVCSVVHAHTQGRCLDAA